MVLMIVRNAVSSSPPLYEPTIDISIKIYFWFRENVKFIFAVFPCKWFIRSNRLVNPDKGTCSYCFRWKWLHSTCLFIVLSVWIYVGYQPDRSQFLWTSKVIKKRFTCKNIIDVLTISVKFKSQFNRSNLKIPRSKIDENQPTMR